MNEKLFFWKNTKGPLIQEHDEALRQSSLKCLFQERCLNLTAKAVSIENGDYIK